MALIRLILGLALVTVSARANVWRRQNRDDLKAELECGQKPADIVFVLDESGSIWGPHFKLQTKFVKGVTDYMDVSFNQTKIAVETFSDSFRVQFQLGDVVGAKKLHSRMDEIVQKRGGTKTYLALENMRVNMFAEGRVRKWVPQIAIIITDGESEDTDRTVYEANMAKDQGIQIFAIGVGHSINPRELKLMASDEDKVFSVDNFAALEKIKIELAIKTCEVTTIPPPSTTTTTTTTTPAPTTTLPQYIQGCRGRYAPDIMFTIPDELGITDTQFSIDFIKEVVGDLEIGALMTRAGLAPRKCETAKGIRLKDHDTASAINAALDRRYLQGAAIDRQLEYLTSKAFTPGFGGRPDAARFAVMIIDNQADDSKATLDAALTAQEQMDIFVIGVGDYIDREEAMQIASADEFAMFVDSFSDLTAKKDELITKICQSLNGPIPEFK